MKSPQKIHFSIRKKIILGFGLAVLMLASIGVMTYRSTRDFIEAGKQVTHSRRVLELHQSLLLHLMEAEWRVRGYVIASQETGLQPYRGDTDADILRDLNGLKEQCSGSSEQEHRLQCLAPLISNNLALLKSAMEARRKDGVDAATRILADKHDAEWIDGIRKTLLEIAGDEQRLLKQRTDQIDEIGRSTTVVNVLATLASVLLLLMAGTIILRDIAARRRAEEALSEEHNLFASIMDALPDQVFVKDIEGRFVVDNIAHRKFLQVKPSEEVEGKSESHFFPEETAAKLKVADESVARTGQPAFNLEELVVGLDGKIAWLSMTKLPLRDTDGKIIGIVCVSANINNRKEDEEKLRLAAAQLQRSNNELQEFASVASHDLQEPLRKIQAFGDRLRLKCGDVLGEAGNDYLERMQDAARRMQILLHDLLTLSRVTSKAQPFEKVDFGKVLSQVVSDLEVHIEQLGAKIEIGDLPSAEVDASQMRQLFQNLLSNALKFQRPGVRPEISIAGTIMDSSEPVIPGAWPGDRVCRITLRDNGIGFDKKYAERIFTVFQRLHSRSEYEGTGIGLAVCRKILERHGGTIVAESAEGEGATFIVTLPLKQRIKEPNE